MSAFDPERWPDPHRMLTLWFYRRLNLRSGQWAIAEDLAGKVVKAVLEAEARGQAVDERYVMHTATMEGRQYWQREHPKAERQVPIDTRVVWSLGRWRLARDAADRRPTRHDIYLQDTIAEPHSSPEEALAEADPWTYGERVPDVDWKPRERQIVALYLAGYSPPECDRLLGLRPRGANDLMSVARRRWRRQLAKRVA